MSRRESRRPAHIHPAACHPSTFPTYNQPPQYDPMALIHAQTDTEKAKAASQYLFLLIYVSPSTRASNKQLIRPNTDPVIKRSIAGLSPRHHNPLPPSPSTSPPLTPSIPLLHHQIIEERPQDFLHDTTTHLHPLQARHHQSSHQGQFCTTECSEKDRRTIFMVL